MKSKFRVFKVVKFAGMFLFFAVAVGFATMGLWNWLVPALFHGPIITYWQALGLLVLSKILFGGFRGRGHHGGGWKGGMRGEYMRRKLEERMSTMTEEEKEKLRNRYSYWENKGGRHSGFWKDKEAAQHTQREQ